MTLRQKKFFLLLILLLSSIFYSCVESLSESTTSSITPAIAIYSPKTNDTIKIGTTTINYAAYDGTGGEGLSHFDLYINGAYAQKIAMGSDGSNPAISISVDSTMIGKKISYYIIVYNKQGKSKTSTTQSNIYIKDKAPKAPSNLIAGFTNSTAVTLLWNDNSGNEKGFEVWRKDITGSGVKDYHIIQTVSESNGNSRSTIDNTIIAGGAYYYKVRAFNYTDKNNISTYEYSNFSNEADPNSSIGGAWNIHAESITDPSIHLYWNDFIPSEQGFIIERTPSFTSGSSTLLLAQPNLTEYVDKDVISNTTYSYKLAYFTSTYTSAYSNAYSVSTYYTAISAPTLVQFFTPLTSSASGFHLEWKENSKTTMRGTIIQRMQLLPFVDWQDVDNMPITDIATNTYDDTKTTVGRAYKYRIRQFVTNGSSSFYTQWTETADAIAK